MHEYICLFLSISILWQRHVFAVKILVEPVIYKRFFPFETDLNFSKDWTDECDVPCVWTGDSPNVDAIFYILTNNWDVFYAYMAKKRAPISIGGSTEGKHYYYLLSNHYFRQIFTASALLASDSEIPWRIRIGDYRELRKVEPNSSPFKMAVSTVFNCNSKNYRERITLELDQIMPVARIGKCLNNKPWPKCRDRDCTKQEALRKYAFCLAFENGDTPGYVTEKVFDCHRAGSIPVYLGTADVLKFVPKGSIIYAGDFKSSFDLAYYLVEVATNESLYQSYFDWKSAPLEADFVRLNQPFWDYKIQCRVCRYVWVTQQGLIWDSETQNESIEPNESNMYNPADKSNSHVRHISDSSDVKIEKESNSTNNLSSYIFLIFCLFSVVLILTFYPFLKVLRVRTLSRLFSKKI
ncbi:hypothetical protein LOD99_13915 [Oopsacas minuta]|uniref:Fucosyltransferase n=1 Tax=Oopsacas minuta TaxID=111878 RepID=A0AAV7KGB4_9METZ|nr:hypothetical protein LOD99_13915 [Oopsacas minuta]